MECRDNTIRRSVASIGNSGSYVTVGDKSYVTVEEKKLRDGRRQELRDGRRQE